VFIRPIIEKGRVLHLLMSIEILNIQKKIQLKNEFRVFGQNNSKILKSVCNFEREIL